MTDRLQRLFNRLQAGWTRFRESRGGQRVLTGVRWLFTGGVLAYLVYQLTTIGWVEVGRSLPTTPWFYILLLLMYATLPATEAVLYGRAWSISSYDLLPVLLRKRVLNNDVLGYSGEAYFYLWVKNNLGLARRRIAETIKDNMIISSVSSTSVAFLLLAVFFLTGQIALLERFLPDATSTLAGGIAVAIGVIAVGINFRRFIFSVPPSLLWLFSAGHLTRFVLNNGLQVMQWAIVIPEVGIGAWITLLALHIVINQIPFVPARGLFFLSASVELSGPLEIPTAAVASMLLAQSLIDRALNLLIYLGTTAAEITADEVTEDSASLPDEIR